MVEENTIAKSTKFAIEFDGTLFKREKLTMIRIIITIIAIIALFTEFTTEFESFCAIIQQ